VPTQADLEQLERDLRKAVAETKSTRRKPSLWQRMTGRGAQNTEAGATASDEKKTEAEQAPDPVPPSAPQPAPAGTPSGPT
jgi:hypothetical protein